MGLSILRRMEVLQPLRWNLNSARIIINKYVHMGIYKTYLPIITHIRPNLFVPLRHK
jgi:hypothetical protein